MTKVVTIRHEREIIWRLSDIMKKKLKRIFLPLQALCIGIAMIVAMAPARAAKETEETGMQMSSAGIGAALALGEAQEVDAQTLAIHSEIREFSSGETEVSENTEFVIANADSTLSVREQPGEESEKVGVLYKNNSGRILAQKDGWTKLQSGDLIGWASDAHLLFGEEATARAKEVGIAVVTVQSDALWVRTEASEEAEALTMVVKGNQLPVSGEERNGWIGVAIADKTGYVRKEFVKTDYLTGEGETLAEIRIREKEEEERKAKEEAERKAAEEAEQKAKEEAARQAAIAQAQAEAAKKAAEQAAAAQAAAAPVAENNGAYAATPEETLLLAALIYCEAGNQPHAGKVAVGAVVMNRLRSPRYPNTIRSVIYAPGQFTPALNGKVDRLLASGNIQADCILAAQEALSGVSPVGNAIGFRLAGKRAGIVIGDVVFF